MTVAEIIAAVLNFVPLINKLIKLAEGQGMSAEEAAKLRARISADIANDKSEVDANVDSWWKNA